ncbi:hypothetical protein GCM10011387_32350 [Pedobacter quisquiliarum]|jgi:transcriptional regulator with XRE-family HTH domain|uniref:HTH cro/C1-type domain-containing protein n=1 Tax=Pedobacter quisquiliarum TaxID=1834438 RepID=A0A916UKY3_9SPHI|nr:hypothetical protein GCM10011387_32350 [Pedobacter quisquiliarum]
MRETLGEYIRNLRKEHNMTLTKLAAALDIDQSSLSKIENNKKVISEDILPALAQVFKLDVKILEKEYYSEKIAELIYRESDSSELFKLANEKASYLRAKYTHQGNLNL